jgi:Tol biopolymer transport system component
MTSTEGVRFGPYLIQTSLGRGGMGEVHRAVDTRLHRTVALKVLPPEVASNPLRQQRFEREARALSALNHPNICALYDLGEQDGLPFLVMEYVEGETLRDRLLDGPMAIDRVLECAMEIASALDHAHHHGVVHRDLKPANVMLTKSGVKVVDFGVARLLADDAGASGGSHPGTLSEPGTLIGTPQYMAPEQLQGREADARSDIFAFGAVVYEMGTGRPAFPGQNAVNIIAAILTSEPPPMSAARLEQRPGPSDIDPSIAPLIDQIIGRCLAKKPDERWQTARDLRQMLEWVGQRTDGSAGSIALGSRKQGHLRFVRTTLTALGLLAAMVAAFVLGFVNDSSNRFGRYRYTPVATDAGFQGWPAWSPDGKTLAYVADVDGLLQVFTKPVGSPLRAQVTHARFDCREPFWSPDGTRIYYISLARDRDGLWSISAAGGAPELVMENTVNATLSPDGKTLAFLRDAGTDFSGQATLWFSSPPGTPPTQYVREPLGTQRFSEGVLHFSPDSLMLGAWLESDLEKQDRRRADLWMIPLVGDPRIAWSLPPELRSAPFSWMPDGRYLVTALRMLQSSSSHLWLVDTRLGSSTPLTASSSNETEPAVTPDGTRIAMTVREADYDIFEIGSDRPSLVPIIATSRNELDPAWSAAGSQMAFMTERAGEQEIWLRSARGEWERPLVRADTFTSPTYLLGSPAFSPDGQRLAFFRRGEANRIWVIPIAGGTPVQIAPGDYAQNAATWSQDGDWIAYIQGTNGSYSLAKIRMGANAKPEVLARDVLPQSKVEWSPDGAWIAYSGRNGLTIVSPDGKNNRAILDQTVFGFAWSEDSRRLVGLRPSDDFRHLTFMSVDIASRKETVISAHLIPMPLAAEPVSGFTRLSSTRFATAIPRVRSDLWMLDGFQRPGTLWDRVSRTFLRQPYFFRRAN